MRAIITLGTAIFLILGGCADPDGTGAESNNPSNPSNPSSPSSTGTPSNAQDAASWTDFFAGKHLYVYQSASSFSGGVSGSASVSGGVSMDLYLCSDKSYQYEYVDTTCTSVSVEGMSGSNCDGQADEYSDSGQWAVEMDQGIAYLVFTSNMGDVGYYPMDVQNDTIYVYLSTSETEGDWTPVEIHNNDRCS